MSEAKILAVVATLLAVFIYFCPTFENVTAEEKNILQLAIIGCIAVVVLAIAAAREKFLFLRSKTKPQQPPSAG